MNKIIATAALSLMFVACSDNSSSVGVGPQSMVAQSQVRNFSAPCIYSIKAEPSEDIADGLPVYTPLTAVNPANNSDENVSRIYPADSEGFALVTVENLKLGCSYDVVGADVVAEGDTLFVNTKIEGSDEHLDCICPRKISFEVKYDSSFANVKYTKVDGFSVFPLQKMEPDSVVTEFNQMVEGNVALHLGECKNGLGLNKAAESSESNKAYLIFGESGYQVFIPNLSDYCGFMGGWMSERVGDTLRVWIEHAMGVTKCICIKDHWFDVSASDADIKYFVYSDVVYEVVVGDAPAESK